RQSQTHQSVSPNPASQLQTATAAKNADPPGANASVQTTRATTAKLSVAANRAARISPRTSCPAQTCARPGQALRAAIQSRLGTFGLLPGTDRRPDTSTHPIVNPSPPRIKPRARRPRAVPAPAAGPGGRDETDHDGNHPFAS